MNKILKLNASIIIICAIVFAQNGHFAPCDQTHGTQECYGYAAVRSLGHPANDPWCKGSTISLSVIPSAFYDIIGQTNLSSLKSSVVENNLIGWSAHAAVVVAKYYIYTYPQGWGVSVGEKEYSGGPVNADIDLDDVI